MYKGYVFLCRSDAVTECVRNRRLTCSDEQVKVAREIEEGAVVFLLNVETNALVGPFTAAEKTKTGLEPGTWSSKVDRGSFSGNISVEWEELHRLENAPKKIPFLEGIKNCVLSHFQTQELLTALKEASQFLTTDF